jgi:predicted amidohydrolase YtcJ
LFDLQSFGACAAVLLATAVACLPQSADRVRPKAVDTVIVHAEIYTLNPKQPWAESIAITGGQVVAVGTDQEIAAYRGTSTKVIDAKHHLLLPGFTDCHIHFLDGSLSLLQVNLDEAKTIPDIQQLVREFAAKHPESPWVLGRGWSYDVFGTSGMPDKKYLDEIIPDRPVYLEGFDAHTWWANSKALKTAGISRETKDPPGGKFVRDPRTGEPTGVIKEDAADDVVRRVIPLPSRPLMLQALRDGMRQANRAGLVRAISPGGTHVAGGDFEILDLYRELKREGQLTVRFSIALRIEPPEISPQTIKRIESARRRYNDAWILAGSAKFFLDGVIESHTAAMLTPYADDQTQSGNLLWNPELYKKAVRELDAAGVQIYTHAIGDRAVRLALDGYAEAAKANHTKDARHRVEHIETIAAEDVRRFGELGVIASFQPLHAYPNEDTLNIWARNAGSERAQRGFAWYSVQSAGGVLAFGSDWPVVTLNPWVGIQNAVTRQTTDGNPPGGWLPKERISLTDAIKGYTLGAAIAGHRETTEGSLEPAKVADMILLSQDLFQIEPTDIGKTEVLLTMVGGKVVYQTAAAAAAAPASGGN